MEQERFQHIYSKYYILRKEQVKFPARSIEEKTLIQFKGAKSPILENLDEFVSKKLKKNNSLGRDLIEKNKVNIKQWMKILNSSKSKKDSPIVIMKDSELLIVNDTFTVAKVLLYSYLHIIETQTWFSNEIWTLLEQSLVKIQMIDRNKSFLGKEQMQKCYKILDEGTKLLQSFYLKQHDLKSLTNETIELSYAKQQQIIQQQKQKIMSFKMEEEKEQMLQIENKGDQFDFFAQHKFQQETISEEDLNHKILLTF